MIDLDYDKIIDLDYDKIAVCCEKIEYDSKSYAENTSSNKNINKAILKHFKDFAYALVENLNDIIDYILNYCL